ncbi:MAG: DUF2384 domain-containing protein [Marinilabiliaceae bacterium]|nr:DUF2384 domain-containing protein [Marinilabiliaceae bacterium]
MTATIEKEKNGNYYLPLSVEIINEFNLDLGDNVEVLQRCHDILVVPLPNKLIKNRDGEDIPILYEVIIKEFRGVRISYVSRFYMDYAVDEETFKIDRSRKEKFYTSEQVAQNLKAFKEAYNEARGEMSNMEILLRNIDSQNQKELMPLIDKGVEVFSCFDKFSKWLYEENLVLGSRPIELLSSDTGTKKVIDILGRIAHGSIS